MVVEVTLWHTLQPYSGSTFHSLLMMKMLGWCMTVMVLGAVASKTQSIDLEDPFAKALMRCQQTGGLFVYVPSTGALSCLTSKRGQYTETTLDVKHGKVGDVSKHQCFMLEIPRDGFRLFWHCFNIYSLLQLNAAKA